MAFCGELADDFLARKICHPFEIYFGLGVEIYREAAGQWEAAGKMSFHSVFMSTTTQ